MSHREFYSHAEVTQYITLYHLNVVMAGCTPYAHSSRSSGKEIRAASRSQTTVKEISYTVCGLRWSASFGSPLYCGSWRGTVVVVFENVYGDLITYEEMLSYSQEACEKLACRLDYRLSLQGGEIGEFTVLIISPVVIVSSNFAIHISVLPYKRNGLSFFLSVAAVVFLLWLLSRLKGGWLHRQGWWEKLSRRARTLRRRRDSSIVNVNEGEPRVLRRRNTHADFSRGIEDRRMQRR
ncbi:hypothetical protein B0T12DRAFT_251038 [Alternaria alternata]|jgi:hypothetical protein|nr:hypothetical protein B0T12DRAFT_251038 [Alternaria alternata]